MRRCAAGRRAAARRSRRPRGRRRGAGVARGLRESGLGRRSPATNWWAAGKALDALRPRFERARRPAVERRHRGRARPARSIPATATACSSSRRHRRRLSRRQPGHGALRGRASRRRAPIEPLTATARRHRRPAGDLGADPGAGPGPRGRRPRRSASPRSQVTLYPMLVGGGFGRKLETDAIEQAAIIAVQLGRPVQLTWPRIQEIQRDTLPPAGGGADDRLGRARAASIGWQARIAAPATAREVARTAARRRQLAVRPDGGRGRRRGAALCDRQCRDRPCRRSISALRPASGAAGAHSYTCFFTESFIDELARAAGHRALVVPHAHARRQPAAGPRLPPRPRSAAGTAARRAAAWASPATAPSARTSPPWSRSR